MTQYSSFGVWLRSTREFHDLTREECAQKVGCSARTIRHFEDETRRPSKAMLERIFGALEVATQDRQQLMYLARSASGIAETPPPSPVTQSVISRPPLAMIGRDADVAHVLDHVQHPDIRVMTILGPPGVGKTRLASEVAYYLSLHTALRVAMIPLATVTDAAFIADAIADVLSIPASTQREKLLIGVLNAQPMVLFLDNVEHLGEVAVVVERLLHTVPALKVVSTSRTPLHLYGEDLIDLHPLSLPVKLDGTWHAVQESAAVQLFRDRTQMINRPVHLSKENQGLIAEICVWLDGLPLAIELAAARLRTVSLAQLHQELTTSRIHLTSPYVNVGRHHASIAHALEWSYRLLPLELQQFWCDLSIFAGGWNSEIVANVLELDQALVERRCEELLQHNVVLFAPERGTFPWSMLHVIREYGVARLAEQGSVRQQQVMQALNAYVSSAVLQAHLLVHQQQFAEAMQAIEVLLPLIRSMLQWLFVHDPQSGIMYVEHLAFYWFLAGMPAEGQWWLQQACEAAVRLGDPTIMGRLLLQYDATQQVDVPVQEPQDTLLIPHHQQLDAVFSLYSEALAEYKVDTGTGQKALHVAPQFTAANVAPEMLAACKHALDYWQSAGIQDDYAVQLLNKSLNLWYILRTPETATTLQSSQMVLQLMEPTKFLLSALISRTYTALTLDRLELAGVLLAEMFTFPQLMLYHMFLADLGDTCRAYLYAVGKFEAAIKVCGAVDRLRVTYSLDYQTPILKQREAQEKRVLRSQVSLFQWSTCYHEGEQIEPNQLYDFLKQGVLPLITDDE